MDQGRSGGENKKELVLVSISVNNGVNFAMLNVFLNHWRILDDRVEPIAI